MNQEFRGSLDLHILLLHFKFTFLFFFIEEITDRLQEIRSCL